jgi:putative ABC transport system permease protein
MRRTRWLEEFRDDVRFAVRQLKMAPGFTFVAAITLALGIGANGAIFSLVDTALLRPLPLPEPGRLAIAFERSDSVLRGPVSPLNMLDWNDRTRTFEKMAGYIPGVGSMVMAGASGASEGVPRQWVTSGVFDVLGLRPVAGRTFLPSDDTQEILALVGVFGIVAYSVQQRLREFGVRIALGATTKQVLVLVLGSAARLIGAGAIIGLASAAILSRAISAFLFGVQPLDPVTFGSVMALLVLMAGIAAAIPALRAARVDPVEAFRNE